MKKIKAKIDKMHCGSCAIRIDGDLEETAGILSSETNFHNAQSTIQFDESKINEHAISEVIEKAGYKVAQIEVLHD